MNYSSVTLARVCAIMVLALTTLTVGACSNSAISTEPAAGNVAPPASGVSPQTTGGRTYYTVDDPNVTSGDYEVTGINNAREIVGDYVQSVSSLGNVWQGYTATCVAGETSKKDPCSGFTPIDWPEDPQGTYMAGISSTGNGSPVIQVGYVEAGPDVQGELGPGVWGVVDNQGLWSAIPKPGTGCKTTSKNVVEVLAFDGNQTAVGFHSNASCINVPFEIINGDTTSQTRFNGLPWTTNTEATGIDATDDIVGTTQGSSTKAALGGWYLKSTTSTTPQLLHCCNKATGTHATSFTGIATIQSVNWISGWYTDNKGTHGLLYNTGGTGNSAWTTIDEPNASNYTIVNGINKKGDICGWYKDASGKTHGFIAIQGSPAYVRERHHRLG
jgi:hypothetical protein